jgi:hypothetical protein
MRHANARLRLAIRKRVIDHDAREIHLANIQRNGPCQPLPLKWERLLSVTIRDAQEQRCLRTLARAHP